MTEKSKSKSKSKKSKGCCVPDCPTGLKGYPEERSSTFPFPKDLEVQKQWVERINREFLTGISYHRVCERHFLPQDLVPAEDNLTFRGKKKVFKKLKDDAIPSQNLNNSVKKILGRRSSKRRAQNIPLNCDNKPDDTMLDDYQHSSASVKMSPTKLDHDYCGKPKYKLLTIQESIEIIDKVEHGIPKADVAKAYGVSLMAVDRIYLNHEKLKTKFKMVPLNTTREHVSQRTHYT